MHSTLHPFALVRLFVGEIQCSLSMPFIFGEVTDKYLTILEFFTAFAMFLTIEPVANILHFLLKIMILPISIKHVVPKVTLINVTVSHNLGTFSLCDAVYEFTWVIATIRPAECALSLGRSVAHSLAIRQKLIFSQEISGVCCSIFFELVIVLENYTAGSWCLAFWIAFFSFFDLLSFFNFIDFPAEFLDGGFCEGEHGRQFLLRQNLLRVACVLTGRTHFFNFLLLSKSGI